MNKIRAFDLKRFFLLTRNDLFLNRSYVLISLAVVGGILFLFSTVDIIRQSNQDPDFYLRFYSVMLSISGFLMTRKIFKDLHDDVKGVAWLTLPASLFEKIASRVALSTIVWAAIIVLSFFLISLISEGVNLLLIGRCHSLFSPFDKDVFLRTVVYFILVSIYHLGLVYFKRHAVFKTFLSLFIYFLFLCLTAYITAKIFFGGLFTDVLYMSDPVRNIPLYIAENDNLVRIWSLTKWTVKIGFWYVLAPLCWIIGYFRLRETEI